MAESSFPAGTSVELDKQAVLKAMALRGWNQNDLAREAGISQPTVSAALRGESVSARTAKAIKEALDRVPPTLADVVIA